ncbi:hypothetical protein FPV67DRAFT_1428039 [Lyophyllum atratum]|nr:hypothetical protein FPV67DRAFT_1428039 [Lyophyllum atratum]
MKRQRKDSPITSVSLELADRYKRTKHDADGPSLEDFGIDFGGKNLASDWNRRATELFAEKFIACDEYQCRDINLIEATFRTHLIQLKERYRASLKEPTHEEWNCVREKKRVARRYGLFRRRKSAFHAYKNVPSMKHFERVWSALKMKAMSGDESVFDGDASDSRRYITTKLRWRDSSVDEWLKVFDKLHLSTRFNLANEPGPGQFPHRRVVSTELARRGDDPVKGLPRNFYDEEWLRGLNKSTRDKLNIQDAVDLSFSTEILRFVLPV